MRNKNNKQVPKFGDITNELCVVAGEIYGSDVYLADVPVFNIDDKGEVKPTEQAGIERNGMERHVQSAG